MIYEIPLTSDPTSYTQETALEGTTYRFTVRWHAREGAWYLMLSDVDDVPIAAGLKLVAGADLLRYVTDDRRPPGMLYMGATPTETTLGTEALLYYADAEEVAAA